MLDDYNDMFPAGKVCGLGDTSTSHATPQATPATPAQPNSNSAKRGKPFRQANRRSLRREAVNKRYSTAIQNVAAATRHTAESAMGVGISRDDESRCQRGSEAGTMSGRVANADGTSILGSLALAGSSLAQGGALLTVFTGDKTCAGAPSGLVSGLICNHCYDLDQAYNSVSLGNFPEFAFWDTYTGGHCEPATRLGQKLGGGCFSTSVFGGTISSVFLECE
ncbi:hypothetical protein DFH09DRAFT_1092254 [Mycena vulgaris]|nr:hypothetical protein DFH09DRAFT_1092254 [Mycena vulgaris]